MDKRTCNMLPTHQLSEVGEYYYLYKSDTYWYVSLMMMLMKMHAFFLKLFVLLYADDTIILADTAEDLQNALNNYQLYCNTWGLNINSSKTKVVIFARGRLPNFTFILNEDEVEIAQNYKYLGVMFSRSGSFLTVKKKTKKKKKTLLAKLTVQYFIF